MNAPHPNGKSHGKEPPATLDGFPLPQALWPAVNRDPDGVMALNDVVVSSVC